MDGSEISIQYQYILQHHHKSDVPGNMTPHRTGCGIYKRLYEENFQEVGKSTWRTPYGRKQESCANPEGNNGVG